MKKTVGSIISESLVERFVMLFATNINKIMLYIFCMLGIFTSGHCMETAAHQPSKSPGSRDFSCSSSSSSSTAVLPKNSRFTTRTALLFNRLPQALQDLIWDNLRTWQQAKRINAHSCQVTCLSYCPDGSQLATGSDDRSIKIWDAASGTCLHTIGGIYDNGYDNGRDMLPNPDGHRSSIQFLRYLPDGKKLIVADEHIIKIWNPFNGKCLQTIPAFNFGNRITSLIHCLNGTQIAAAAWCGRLKIWNAHTGQNIFSIIDPTNQLPDGTPTLKDPAGHKAWITNLQACPNDSHIVSVSRDLAIKIWNTTTGQCVSTIGSDQMQAIYNMQTNQGASLQYNLDGTQLTCFSDNSQKTWDLSTGKLTQPILPQLTGARDYCMDNTHLIYLTSEAIQMWNVATGNCVQTIEYDEEQDGRFTDLSIHPNSKQFATSSDSYFSTGSNSHVIKIWKLLPSEHEHTYHLALHNRQFKNVLKNIAPQTPPNQSHESLEK